MANKGASVTTARDDFSKSVVRTVGLRAGYTCSNPNCRKLTAGPHSNPAKHVITGEAAHIHAAAPGGPRYDSAQTPEQRKSITNAIWLCAVCAKKVDTDWARWPADELRKMKEDHEKWIDGQEMIPKIPEFTLSTQAGLRLHQNLASVTEAELKLLREQQLIIHNNNRIPVYNLNLMMFLPEDICLVGSCSWNPSTQLDLRPDVSNWSVQSVAGTNRVAARQAKSTANHRLAISEIPAGERVELSFYTANPAEVKIIDSPEGPWRPAPDPDSALPPNRLTFFIEGTYQFVLRGEYVTTEILVPLKFNFKERLITSLPAQASREPWDLTPIIAFPGVEIHG